MHETDTSGKEMDECVVTRKNGHEATIILVEDYDDSRFMMRQWLELSGYRVVEARDGLEAVNATFSNDPDLILMDLGLPGVTGFEATRRIRAFYTSSELPIVAVTAFSSEGCKSAARKAGCDEFVSKPVNFDALAVIITHLLTA